MSNLDLFDTSAVQDDVNSWDALAARITAAAVAARSDSLLGWLASPRAAAVTAFSLAVGVVVVLLARHTEAPRVATAREEWRLLLAPSDRVGRTLATGDQPPAVGQLLSERGDIR